MQINWVYLTVGLIFDTNTWDQFNKTFKPHAIGRNFVGPTTSNFVGCYMLRPFAHPVACCWMLLRVVAQSLKPVKLFSQQLPTFLLFSDRRSVAQQCWIRLYSSFNIVGATYAHYTWSPKSYGLYPSHDALQVPTLLVWFEWVVGSWF